MKLEIDIPDFQKEDGVVLKWDYGFKLEVKGQSSGSVIIKANEAGLISLARHLLSLSIPTVSSGYHIHLDDLNSLEDGSLDLVIEKED